MGVNAGDSSGGRSSSDANLEPWSQGFRQLLWLQQGNLSWEGHAQALLDCLESTLGSAAFVIWVESFTPILSSRLSRIPSIEDKLSELETDVTDARVAEAAARDSSPEAGFLPLSFPLRQRGSYPQLDPFSHYHELCLISQKGGVSAWLGVMHGSDSPLPEESRLVLEVAGMVLRQALDNRRDVRKAAPTSRPSLPLPDHDAYGVEAARLLAQVTEGLAGATAGFMDQKWDWGVIDPTVAAIIQNLSQLQIDYFKARMCCHLQFVLAPQTRREDLIESSRVSGWRRTQVGVDATLFFRILTRFRLALHDYLDRQSTLGDERYLILRVIDLRLQDNMEAQIQGQEQVRSALVEYTLQPMPERMAIWRDAVRNEIQELGKIPGIVAVVAIRMGSDGHYRVEDGAGPMGQETMSVINRWWDSTGVYDSPLNQSSLMVKAWQSGQILGSPNLVQQNRGEVWASFFRQLGAIGARSSIHVPVPNEKGSTVAVLTFMGSFPNQFESLSFRQFLRSVQQRWGEIWLRCAHPAPAIELEQSITYRQRLFSGGLQMYVQPMVDLYTGHCLKVEALARLVTESGRVVPPGLFIPLLGDTELDRLFRQGLEQSLDQLVQWDAQGITVGLALNLPPSTLLDPDCAGWVESALRTHGVSPGRLTLELLETEAVDSEIKDAAIAKLIGLGIKLAMDDLGSGYSSLQRLANVPFDTIKVDQSLLVNICEAPVKTLSLISAIIQMGIDFDHNVVVEGLEDGGMIEAAVMLGARQGQGFGIARPMPMDAFAGWYRSTRPLVKPEKLETPLGALAFHWRATRQGKQHTADLSQCPLTAFLSRQRGHKEAEHWHAALHATDPSAEASDGLLHYLESLSRS